MKILKKSFAAMVAIAVCVSCLLFFDVISNNAYFVRVYSADNGTCGKNLTWFFNEDEGKLTIKGKGDMYNYTSASGGPWINYCKYISSIEIANGVTSIGDWAFNDCNQLTSVTIPDSVTSIGSSAFYQCSKLKSLTIPESVKTIGDGAFGYCLNLNSISLPEKIKSIEASTFCACTNLSSLKIPESVTSIGGGAFSWCYKLTSITIPKNVTNIGLSAFSDCRSLDYIMIMNPDCIIYDNEATISSSIYRSFNGIIIGYSNSAAQDYAKKYGRKFVQFEPDGSVPDMVAYGTYGNISWTLNNNGMLTISGSGEMELASISPWNNCRNFIKSIVIENGVTNISESAFRDCVNVYSISIPESVTVIGYGAFQNCNKLPSITIPESITAIESSVFQECSNLSSITLSENITTIGMSSFDHCTSLTSISIPSKVTTIGRDAFSFCTKLESVSIPDSVSSIENFTFYNCKSLNSIIIPASVTQIGEYAFYNCSNLVSITILNLNCQFLNSFITISNNESGFTGTIYGYDNSTAQALAEQLHYSFISLGEGDNYIYELDKSSIELEIGGTEKISILSNNTIVSPAKATFKSSADTVAIVDEEGKITAVSPGNTTITVSISDNSYSCYVTVIPKDVITTEAMTATKPPTTTKATTTTRKTTTTTKATTTTRKTTTTTKVTTTTRKTTTTTKATTSTKKTTTTTKVTITTKKTTTTMINQVLPGDANMDKTIDLSDAVLIMQSLANPDKYGLSGSNKNHITEQGAINADVEGGNGLTVYDALTIQRFLLNLVISLPI